MKKLKLSIALILSLTIISNAFAGKDSIGNKPAFKGMENFMKLFPQATGVAYETKGQFTEVNFTWNNLKLQAFYDLDGNWIGTSRTVQVKDLPVNFLLSIRNEYPGFVPTEAIEFDQAETGLSYYVTISGPEKSYVLQLLSDGTTSVFKKMKN
ncbi:MAG TPA: hypothetical protein VKQ08_03760 [Cyclobacteriaceae bacterium]|nr:hypothetical protein [Cyclobacteriaceae bacterium]